MEGLARHARALFGLALLAPAACGGGEVNDGALTGSVGSSGAGGHGGASTSTGEPPPAPLELCINELMPDNAASIIDEAGATPDWLELHNPGAEDVSLDGWSLTDDANAPAKSVLSGGLVLPAGGFLVLWADKLTGAGSTHLSFKLDAGGGVVGLFAPDGRGSVVTYGAIDADFSAARRPDCCVGEGCFAFDFRGSPGKSNVEHPLETVTVLPAGSVYRYLDTGIAPPADWMMNGFDDSVWPSGPAPLGYGDPHIVTSVSFGPDPAKKPVTTWFRTVFKVTGHEALAAASLDVLRDDGARVYLNGTEVARSNLPDGELAPTTLAVAGVGGVEETSYAGFMLDPALFVEGTNALAVEVHQATADSSDLGMDVVISVKRPAP